MKNGRKNKSVVLLLSWSKKSVAGCKVAIVQLLNAFFLNKTAHFSVFFIPTCPRHTSVIVMLFNQHLDMSQLSRGWIILEKQEEVWDLWLHLMKKNTLSLFLLSVIWVFDRRSHCQLCEILTFTFFFFTKLINGGENKRLWKFQLYNHSFQCSTTQLQQ